MVTVVGESATKSDGASAEPFCVWTVTVAAVTVPLGFDSLSVTFKSHVPPLRSSAATSPTLI